MDKCKLPYMGRCTVIVSTKPVKACELVSEFAGKVELPVARRSSAFAERRTAVGLRIERLIQAYGDDNNAVCACCAPLIACRTRSEVAG